MGQKNSVTRSNYGTQPSPATANTSSSVVLTENDLRYVVPGHPDINYLFRSGDNVLLKPNSESEKQIKQQGHVGVVTIRSLNKAGDGQTVVATVELYNRAPALGKDAIVSEGGVGIPVGETSVPLYDLLPLPVYLFPLDEQTVNKNLGAATCPLAADALSPWNYSSEDGYAPCESCHPSGAKVQESDFPETVQQIENDITQLNDSSANMRYAQFECPSQVSIRGQITSARAQNCRTVVIGTKTDPTKRQNSYFIVASPNPLNIQKAVLSTFGLPTTSEYRNAVHWSDFPKYKQALVDFQTGAIECYQIDSVSLATLIRELLARAYHYERAASFSTAGFGS